jgi:hypothetical protein
MTCSLLKAAATVVTFLATAQGASAASPQPFSSMHPGIVAPPWKVIGLPERYAKPISQFDVATLDNVQVLRVKADHAWGTLAHPMNETVKPETVLRWRWRLDLALPSSDIRSKTSEDGALKVCLSFDMPIERVPAGERTLIRLVQFFTKEKIPTATLCYLWGAKEPIGYEQASLVTNRVRYVVLANETSALKTWQSVERKVHADFLKAFGHEAQTIPALSAIIIGADSDNTSASSLGYVNDVQLFQP